MSEKSPNSTNQPKPRDPDLAGAEIAIQRAALKAREKARQVGRGVFIWKDGKIVEDRNEIPADTPSPTLPLSRGEGEKPDKS